MTRRLLALALSLAASTATAGDLRAIDGDTLHDGTQRLRIANVDTPETRQAKCRREYLLGTHAKEIAAHILATRSVVVTHTGRSDRYGRPLVRVTVDGVDWIEALRAAGAVAREYDGRSRREGWCE